MTGTDEYGGELQSEQFDEHDRLTADPQNISTIGPATGAYAGGDRGTYPDAAGTSAPTANPVPPRQGVSQGFLHFRQEFNDNWEKYYSGTGRTWDDYQSAYQFGYDVAYDVRFRGRDWTDLEPEVCEVWEAGNHELSWPLVRDAVAYAWERVSHNSLDLIAPGQQ